MTAQHQADGVLGACIHNAPVQTAFVGKSAHAAFGQLCCERLRLGRYVAHIAHSDRDREAAYELRFRVFNLELGEGLSSAAETGRDKDEFDDICDHLLVSDVELGEVVGTYRLQTGQTARSNFGFYSEREFDFSPYARFRSSMLELGRACILKEHRSFKVLTLLWRAILHYAESRGLRYLVGCSSFGSLDARRGTALYRTLGDHLISPELRTTPTRQFAFPLSGDRDAAIECPPKLLRAYLTLGAKICGPPAMDREFGTIDFLTWMDLAEMPFATRARLMA